MSSTLPGSKAVPNEASLPHIVNPRSKRKQRLGLLQVHPIESDISATSDTTIDIIAIHGLNTDGQTTWEHHNGNNGKPVHWLRDKHMLPHRIPQSRIMTYDWNARYEEGASTLTLAAEAVRLIKSVQNDRIEKSRTACPILFIASCFGGLLLAEALVRARNYSGQGEEVYKAVLDATRGIAFLGTPFRGSWAFGTEYTTKITDRAKEKQMTYSLEFLQYLKQTKTDRPSPLNGLIQHFEFLVKARGPSMQITCFFESQESRHSPRLSSRPDIFPDHDNWSGSGIVVDEYSSYIEGAERIGLNLRHNMMNKFNDPEGNEYLLVVGALEGFAKFASSFETESVKERSYRKYELSFPDVQHCLSDMPDLCYPYQPQSAVDRVLNDFYNSEGSKPRKLVLGGFTGRGKTQSCIAFMQEKLKGDVEQRGHSRLLWVAGHSPDALFDSLHNLHECCISEKHQSNINMTKSAQGAEAIANVVSRWLSNQDNPWLMTIDNIDALEPGRNSGDGLKLADRTKMLEFLYRAKGGRIIATASQYPESVSQSSWQKYTVGPMDRMAARALVRCHLSKNDLLSDVPNDETITRLCEILDFLPCGIAIACSTIKARKSTVDTYIRNWYEVFEGTAKAQEQRSLDASFLLCFEALKGRSQSAKDLLDILVCLNTTNVQEKIFQRAWESTRFSRDQNPAVSTTPQIHPYKAFETIWNLIGLATKDTDYRTRYSALDFMEPKPGETTWSDSSAKRHLDDALNILEEASFLRFSRTETNYVISVPPIIHTWMHRSYMSGSLEITSGHNPWWQASSILAASLKPTSMREDRQSESFSAFQRHAAAQINQLAYLKDNTEFQKLSGDSRGSVASWTTDDLLFDQSGDGPNYMADALDLHGYSSLALDIRDARMQSTDLKVNDLEQLVRRATHADSLTRNGYHEKALKQRNAALESLPDLSTPSFPKITSVQAHLHVHKFFRLIIQNDIAESYWNLSRRQEALELYDTVRREFERTLNYMELKTYSGVTRIREAVCEPLNQARLGYAECLVYHSQEYDEAKGIIDTVLKTDRISSNVHSRHTYLRARSLNASIMFIRGYRQNALIERRKIYDEWKGTDEELTQLETMRAQIDYAKNLIVLSKKDEFEEALHALDSIEDLMNRLSRSDKHTSVEFLDHTRQDLAKCYIIIANHGFNRKERVYGEQARSKVFKAATIMQEVWEDLHKRDERGHTHPETLKSLVLLIKYEKYTELCSGPPYLPVIVHLQALEETKAKMSVLEGQSSEIKRAWLYVQLETCLVNDQAKRIRRLESLLARTSNQVSDTPKDRKSRLFELEIRYQIATAQMNPLRYCQDKRQLRAMKKDQMFTEATESLIEVWRQRYGILGPGNQETALSLETALSASEIVKTSDRITLQAWQCATFAEYWKDNPHDLEKSENKLHALQRERGIEPPKLWRTIIEESQEFLTR